MIERRRGHLVGMSSLASFRGLPLMAGYCASKAGVNSLFDTLRVELEPLGIVATTICPGWIRTQMTQRVQANLRDILELKEATRHILDAVRRRECLYAFPRSGCWRMRLLRWLPRHWSDGLVRRYLAQCTKK
jgi:short-subunit dehydrogenase